MYCTVLYSVWISKKYTVLEYGLSVFMSQIQRRITAVTLFPTLQLPFQHSHYGISVNLYALITY
jgi:hypothetical protein